MSTQHAERPPAKPAWPAKSLEDVTAVIRRNADDDVKTDFEAALERAWATAKAESSLEPMTRLVETWWPQALFWNDREHAREVMARVRRYQTEGPPPRDQRFSREQAIAMWEARHGRKLGS